MCEIPMPLYAWPDRVPNNALLCSTLRVQTVRLPTFCKISVQIPPRHDDKPTVLAASLDFGMGGPGTMLGLRSIRNDSFLNQRVCTACL